MSMRRWEQIKRYLHFVDNERTLASTHGIIHNVELAVNGKPIPRQDGHPEIGATGNLVLKLASVIPQNVHTRQADRQTDRQTDR